MEDHSLQRKPSIKDTRLLYTLDELPHNEPQPHNIPVTQGHAYYTAPHEYRSEPHKVGSHELTHGNDGHRHGDYNKRSDEIHRSPEPMIELVPAASNSYAAFSQPVQSTPSTREGNPLMPPQNLHYSNKPKAQAPPADIRHDHIPHGQPLPPILNAGEDLPTISKDSKYTKITKEEVGNHQCKECKIAFFGAPHVGKTSIIRRFIDNQFVEGFYNQTTVFELKQFFFKRDDNNKHFKLIVWDIGHAQDLDTIDASVFDKCGVAIIVFDVNDHATLRAAQQCWEKVNRRVGNYPTKFLLVGNKCDLPVNDDVNQSKHKARAFANRKEIQYYETSAKQIENDEIALLFEKAVDKALEARAQYQARAPDQPPQNNANRARNRDGQRCAFL